MSRLMHLVGESPRGACICVPTYGALSPACVYALMSSVRSIDPSVGIVLLHGDCHVDDARNSLVAFVLREGYQSLIFIDADTVWRASDLKRLLAYDRDVVGGVPPLKSDATEFRCRHLPGPLQADAEGLLEVEATGTAFLKISRAALETLSATVPSARLSPTAEPFPLIFERTVSDGDRFSGDYSFCRRWRALEGKVFIDPMMRFGHVGEKEWNGCYGAWLRKINHLTLSGIESIKLGRYDMETMQGLREDWENDFAASAELLFACAETAREARLPIVEYGSGLSTLVMAAANPGIQIHAVEHDAQWLNHTHAQAQRHGLTNVQLWLAPLGADGFYDLRDVLLPEDVALRVLDGPPRHLGKRAPGLSRLNGSAVLIDDLDEDMREQIQAWADANGRHFVVIHNFAAIRAKHS